MISGWLKLLSDIHTLGSTSLERQEYKGRNVWHLHNNKTHIGRGDWLVSIDNYELNNSACVTYRRWGFKLDESDIGSGWLGEAEVSQIIHNDIGGIGLW